MIAGTLAAIGEDAGARAPAMEAARETFVANTRAANEAGVVGAPFYIVEGKRFWGNDRLDDLD